MRLQRITGVGISLLKRAGENTERHFCEGFEPPVAVGVSTEIAFSKNVPFLLPGTTSQSHFVFPSFCRSRLRDYLLTPPYRGYFLRDIAQVNKGGVGRRLIEFLLFSHGTRSLSTTKCRLTRSYGCGFPYCYGESIALC